MATHASNMTRSSSTDSSALSNIDVAGMQDDDAISDRVPASTPPTSLTDGSTSSSTKAAKHLIDITEEEATRRPKRARAGPSTYNLKKIFDAQEAAGSRSRNVSGLTGRTLVGDDDIDDGAFLGKKTGGSAEMVSVPESSKRPASKLQRQPSLKDRFKNKFSKVSSALGKRKREVVEASKRKLGMTQVGASPKQNKIMKELDLGAGGVLDELDLSDDDFEAPLPPPKRVKTTVSVAVELTKPTAPPIKAINGKNRKPWLQAGLYVGQDPEMDTTVKSGDKKLQKKQRPNASGSDGTQQSAEQRTDKSAFMPLPMWSYLEKDRDFKVPYDVYAPSLRKGHEKPRDWTKLNKNRLVGDAKELWEKQEKLPSSMCVCKTPDNEFEQGCTDDCLNRVMQYECNHDNCKLDALRCSNRAFAELAARTKKGGSYDSGVEVIKTSQRGFGIRAARSFSPGQIIMEYTGEIISEGECQRRMREEYNNKQCYYLMELERGLIIDGTKGSMARFINHSCSPNCEVRMVKVNGTPRMAVFAGEDGVMTGEELTYDYNFDNFGAAQQPCYCGSANCRGTLSKRLNAAEQKKQAREANERKRKAAEEAQREAANEATKKKTKAERGSNWRGWLAVDDPETKERLRAEKKAREEAEMNSSRAQRLAARRQSLPASIAKTPPSIKKRNQARRKTLQATPPQEFGDAEITGEADHEMIDIPYQSNNEAEDASAGATITESHTRSITHSRTFSTGSKFREELPQPADVHATTVEKRTEVSITTTEVLSDGDDASRDFNNDGTTTKLETKSSLARTASKGKTIMKTVGGAVRKSLTFDTGVPAGGKLRQSTLSWGKVESK